MKKNGFNVLLSNGKIANVRFTNSVVFIRTNERVKEVDAINCEMTAGGKVYSGGAACSPDDKFNIERGISLALCRAMKDAFKLTVDVKDTKDFFKYINEASVSVRSSTDIALIRSAFRVWLRYFRSLQK